jgi:hypothetical protein
MINPYTSLSRWFHFDREKRRYSYERTENHVFGDFEGHEGKRIGDMTRDELLHVIAIGYHERDTLARAVVYLSEGRKIDERYINTARRIVDRFEDDAEVIG